MLDLLTRLADALEAAERRSWCKTTGSDALGDYTILPFEPSLALTEARRAIAETRVIEVEGCSVGLDEATGCRLFWPDDEAVLPLDIDEGELDALQPGTCTVTILVRVGGGS